MKKNKRKNNNFRKSKSSWFKKQPTS